MLETMTLDEKLAISNRAFELINAGNEEAGRRLLRTAPRPPYLAKIFKEKVGVKPLLDSGWNLSEAEAKFGPNWLSA
jgi:hypothetical protein